MSRIKERLYCLPVTGVKKSSVILKIPHSLFRTYLNLPLALRQHCIQNFFRTIGKETLIIIPSQAGLLVDFFCLQDSHRGF